MRHALTALVFLPLLAIPSVADAGPITAGVNLGLSQSKLDGTSGIDPNRTFGLFGRLAFSARVGGQLELAKFDTADGNADIRTATALLVVDLGARGRLVPTLIAGIGLAHATTAFGYAQEAHHIEGGLGLEYRAEGGFTIGADVRMGGRSLHGDDNVVPLAGLAEGGSGSLGSIGYYLPSSLQEGEYRSARITAGVRF